MKRLIFIWALAFSFPIIEKAQSPTNTSLAIDSMSNSINDLEHRLSYLNLAYELNILKAELNIAASEANIKFLEMKIDLYHSSKFDIDLYDSYKDWYQMALSHKEAFARLIEAKKNLMAITMLAVEFPDVEKNSLFQTCRVVEASFDSYEAALSMVQKILDVWKKVY